VKLTEPEKALNQADAETQIVSSKNKQVRLIGLVRCPLIFEAKFHQRQIVCERRWKRTTLSLEQI
jgi:hypothetical protein